MNPYLDAGFLLTLLINAEGSAAARTALQGCDAPFALNLLHQLQAENLFRQLEKSSHRGRRHAAAAGLRLWAWYFAEGFFHLVESDWSTSFRLAITWNSASAAAPPAPLLLLHPALATVSEATHFLSFDPRARAVALKAGLKLMPEML